jgi:transcriptional regulator with XRE-family HTH domain
MCSIRMAHPAYLRRRARELRQDKKLTIDELAERFSLSRTTIYYWVRDITIPQTAHQCLAQRRATRATKAKHRGLREDAYAEGFREFPELSSEPTFCDFVCMYIGEGYKRDRNRVALANSDPRVVRLADRWIRRFSRNRVTYSLQYHADQDSGYLVRFWSFGLDVDSRLISRQRKSNSGRLSSRSWRSKHGVLTVRASDTALRARLQAWMDRTQDHWLDSLFVERGVAKSGIASGLGPEDRRFKSGRPDFAVDLSYFKDHPWSKPDADESSVKEAASSSPSSRPC